MFVSRHGKWEGKQLLNAEWFDMASANQISTISPANNADNPDWRCGYGFQFWRCVPEHVFRADGAFGQYGVVFEDKDTVLILQSSSSDQQEQLTCAWEALLPAITDEETLPESPMAHVLKKRLEKAEITPMLSSRNPWSEKRLRVRNSRLRRKFRGLSISSAVCGLWPRRAV